jgi:hypothetical protein
MANTEDHMTWGFLALGFAVFAAMGWLDLVRP